MIAAWLSPPKLLNLVRLAVIFFASTQLGLHLWPASSLIYGIRVDYLSPTLYFLDALLVLYLYLTRPKWPGFLSALIPLLLLNLLFSLNLPASLSWSLHLLLYLGFITTLSRSFLQNVRPVIILTLVFQTIVASIQVGLGHSLGGLMYYLGERMVAVGSPAIATGVFMGEVVLRGYGTFSHPNVLAGWLVVSLLICLKLTQNTKARAMLVGLAGLGVLLTQSRAGGLALFGLIIPFYLLNKFRWRAAYLIVLACLSWRFSLLTPARADLSASERRDLQNISASVSKTYPFTGTGAQASLASYPNLAPGMRLLQPDHNAPTLFFSWFGLVGVLAMLSILRPWKMWGLTSLIPLAPLLLLDHYFLTSPQGLFILLLYLKIESALH